MRLLVGSQLRALRRPSDKNGRGRAGKGISRSPERTFVRPGKVNRAASNVATIRAVGSVYNVAHYGTLSGQQRTLSVQGLSIDCLCYR